MKSSKEVSKIPADLRQWVERVLAGESKVSAWCAVKRCENTPAARAAASRAWNGKAVKAYREELELRANEKGGNGTGGEGAIAAIDKGRRLNDAALLSREECKAWLAQALMAGPSDLLDQNPQSPGYGKPRPELSHLCQSIRISPDGTVVLSMPPKPALMAQYIALCGYNEPEKEAKKWTPAGTVEALAAQLAENPDAMDAIEDAVQFTQRALEMAHALANAGSGLAS